jgi:hypothetical protein
MQDTIRVCTKLALGTLKISFRKSDLEKSLEKADRQLSSIEREVRSLEKIAAAPERSNEFYLRLGSLQSMARRFALLIADAQTILGIYMWRPDRMRRLTDGMTRSKDLLVQLKFSVAVLSPLPKNLEDNISEASRAKSIDERIKCVHVLGVSVSVLKDAVAGFDLVLRELVKLGRPRFLEGLVNGLLVTAVVAVLMFASSSLVNLPVSFQNLPMWFQMLIVLIVAIGIFVACLRGNPPVIAIVDLG